MNPLRGISFQLLSIQYREANHAHLAVTSWETRFSYGEAVPRSPSVDE